MHTKASPLTIEGKVSDSRFALGFPPHKKKKKNKKRIEGEPQAPTTVWWWLGSHMPAVQQRDGERDSPSGRPMELCPWNINRLATTTLSVPCRTCAPIVSRYFAQLEREICRLAFAFPMIHLMDRYDVLAVYIYLFIFLFF